MGALRAIAALMLLIAGTLGANCPLDAGVPVPCSNHAGTNCYCPSRNRQVHIGCWKHDDGKNYYNMYDMRTGIAFCPKSLELRQSHDHCVHPSNNKEKLIKDIEHTVMSCWTLREKHCVAHGKYAKCKCGSYHLTFKSYSHDQYLYMFNWRNGEFLCHEPDDRQSPLSQIIYLKLQTTYQKMLKEHQMRKAEHDLFLQKMLAENKIDRQQLQNLTQKLIKEHNFERQEHTKMLQKMLDESKITRKEHGELLKAMKNFTKKVSNVDQYDDNKLPVE